MPGDDYDHDRAKIRKLAKRRRQTSQALKQQTSELRRTIRTAVGAGLTVAEAARVAGLSRETLHRWLRAEHANNRADSTAEDGSP